eukprot:scaffold254214_cov24-Attheya_sp.AAC.1
MASLTKSHQVSPSLTRSHQVSPGLTKSREVPPSPQKPKRSHVGLLTSYVVIIGLIETRGLNSVPEPSSDTVYLLTR